MQGTSNYHPMNASILFYQTILQLAYTTQVLKKFVLCKQAYVMHIQMQHTSL